MSIESYAKEAIIDYNGPLLHEADKYLMASVDHYFTKRNADGTKTLQPHHFFHRNERFSKFTYSKVTDQTLEERSKLGSVTLK